MHFIYLKKSKQVKCAHGMVQQMLVVIYTQDLNSVSCVDCSIRVFD